MRRDRMIRAWFWSKRVVCFGFSSFSIGGECRVLGEIMLLVGSKAKTFVVMFSLFRYLFQQKCIDDSYA